MKHSLRLVTLSAATLLGPTLAAHAAPVTATFNNVAPHRDVDVHLTDHYYSPAQNIDENTPAGVFNWTGVPSNQDPLKGNFKCFCLSLIQDVAYGTTYTFDTEILENAPRPNNVGVGNPPGGTGANLGLGTTRSMAVLIRQLWAHSYTTAITNDDAAAAFQLDVWKILYEQDATSYATLLTGDFHVTGTSAAGAYVPIANADLAYLIANPAAPQELDLAALTNSTAQDQLTIVPEASSLAAAPAVLALARRRRR